MAMTARSRAEILRLLVDGAFPIRPLREELSAYPWDAEEPLLTLHARHVRQLLERYIRGEIAASDVREWAEALETREDVAFADNVPPLAGILFSLANPDLDGPLSIERARDLSHSLRSPADGAT